MTNNSGIQKFPQVDHHEATGELSEAYEDIHSTLRLPWVAFGIRVLATFPHFVPRAWRALQPTMRTLYAERAADAIRSGSIIPGPPPSDPRPKLYELGWHDEDIAQLQSVLDVFNYGNPKYVLLITAWNEAWHDRAAGGNGELSADEGTLIPYGLPHNVEKLNLLDPDLVPPEVQALLRRAKDMHFHHGPASDFRALAAWPDYLRIALDSLEPVVGKEPYHSTAHSIRSVAREHVRHFPEVGGISRRTLSEICAPQEIAGITGVLYMYTHFMSEITIDIIRLKQAFEGAESATESKFSVE